MQLYTGLSHFKQHTANITDTFMFLEKVKQWLLKTVSWFVVKLKVF